MKKNSRFAQIMAGILAALMLISVVSIALVYILQ